ncbi:tRNA (adenosine(37)-N6)-dimethylallyltransferase MiaA [Ruicaihuangia caeni]|uniref:tRNA dimethylallyltransferase n=1 Tax=Ruicaihuangia caeni TaxID=3042517 RepID=A0AAW6TA84_9MICO|nr:tRNA (adenosine(37)-N6)-dimethylallyltransferase MiaA [Klugiella sp. YN-L-19]MDI2099731.1 tRNA (adenosine(37)-N6)-dimethylallyltransferase MiaA [Klugiella sp. YN-L-19]
MLAIVGATGTGKSALSLDLAERLAEEGRPAEIVNADAMQLYRGMDIGTAKVPPAERRGIPHHFFDVLDPADEASVAWFQQEARAAVEQIADRGAVPILVGGSGLYVSAVLFDLRFPGTDPAVRARLERELEDRGPGELHRRLRELDPASARTIDAQNGRRIVRALEVIELTGAPFDAGLPEQPAYWRPAQIIGLDLPRAQLVERLDRRAAEMWSEGIVEEVRSLLADGVRFGQTAGRAIGYAQAIAQLRGELDQASAIEQTAALTRRYARRQVSWFRRYHDARWLSADQPGLVDEALARAA